MPSAADDSFTTNRSRTAVKTAALNALVFEKAIILENENAKINSSSQTATCLPVLYAPRGVRSMRKQPQCVH